MYINRICGEIDTWKQLNRTRPGSGLTVSFLEPKNAIAVNLLSCRGAVCIMRSIVGRGASTDASSGAYIVLADLQ